MSKLLSPTYSLPPPPAPRDGKRINSRPLRPRCRHTAAAAANVATRGPSPPISGQEPASASQWEASKVRRRGCCDADPVGTDLTVSQNTRSREGCDGN